jgi:hypothetical protein
MLTNTKLKISTMSQVVIYVQKSSLSWTWFTVHSISKRVASGSWTEKYPIIKFIYL